MTSTELDLDDEFSVWVIRTDEVLENVCKNVSARDAAREFQRLTHNVSARTGITVAVAIRNRKDFTVLAWVTGKGYTYDGKNYYETPVIPDENLDS